MKKYKFKKWLKAKKKWVIGVGAFLLLGIIALLIGFEMTGWSLVAWLNSPYFTTLIILALCGVVALGCLVFVYILSKLGSK